MGNLSVWKATYLLGLYLPCTWTKEFHSVITTNTTALLPLPVSTTQEVFSEYRNDSFHLDSAVNLTCTDKMLTSVIFSTWMLNISRKECRLALSSENPYHDTCEDGKILVNSTNGVAYLHIPHFKKTDEGVYACEIVYKGGHHKTRINVFARGLQISTRLDLKQREAVCEITGAIDGISITWVPPLNSTENKTSTASSDSSYTLMSRVSLPDHVPHDKLKCSVMHPTWGRERIEILNVPRRHGLMAWQWIIIFTVLLCFLMGVLAGLFIIRTHLSKISNCCKFSMSSVPSNITEKPPDQDVDELEPYASYVQRVNSIYNSSAELCNV